MQSISDIYATYSNQIQTFEKLGRIMDIFNYEVSIDRVFPTTQEIADIFTNVFWRQTFAFKIVVSFGLILLNRETNELLYYHASLNNQRLFDEVFVITDYVSHELVRDQMLSMDLVDHLEQHRPTTKFIIKAISNVTLYIIKLLGKPVGSPPEDFPEYIRKNKGLFSLIKNYKTGVRYADNLCFFRCLAIKNGFTPANLARESRRLFRQYCEFKDIEPSSFGGVGFADLNTLSQFYGIGINVYNQEYNRKTSLVFRSLLQTNIMYLNQYSNHFSYIKDFGKYSSFYICQTCKKAWTIHSHYTRHIKTCDASTTKIFQTGAYQPKQSIFEKLAEENICIPQELHYYEYFLCFDIESLLIRDHDTPNTSRVCYTFKHKLASISVCSNIPTYDSPRCFVCSSTDSTKDLVKSFVEYLTEASIYAYEDMQERFVDYIDIINASGLAEEFDKYLKQVPVLTFNGKQTQLIYLN